MKKNTPSNHLYNHVFVLLFLCFLVFIAGTLFLRIFLKKVSTPTHEFSFAKIHLTKTPHIPGTPTNQDIMKYVSEQFNECETDATIWLNEQNPSLDPNFHHANLVGLFGIPEGTMGKTDEELLDYRTNTDVAYQLYLKLHPHANCRTY